MNNNDFLLNCTDCINFQEEKYVKTSSDCIWLESVCNVVTDNSIVLFYIYGTNSVFIEKVDLNTYQSIAYASDKPYDHANDATYNSTTQKIYLAPMHSQQSGLDRNLLYVINKDTFVKESEIHIGNNTNDCLAGIAYDEINSIYYAVLGSSIVKLDTSFDIISSFPIVPSGISANTFQNIEVYDEKLFVVYNDKILVYDKNANFIKNIAIDATAETDGFVSIGNDNFLIGKVYNSFQNVVRSSLNLFNIFDVGINKTLLTLHSGVNTKNNVQIQNGINYITKRDHTVYCNICFKNISSFGDGSDYTTAIAILPKGFRPSTYIRVIGARSGHNYARFEIDTNGYIYMTASSLTTFQPSHWFHLNTSFIVN